MKYIPALFKQILPSDNFCWTISTGTQNVLLLVFDHIDCYNLWYTDCTVTCFWQYRLLQFVVHRMYVLLLVFDNIDCYNLWYTECTVTCFWQYRLLQFVVHRLYCYLFLTISTVTICGTQTVLLHVFDNIDCYNLWYTDCTVTCF
jgi:hypothetical protein